MDEFNRLIVNGEDVLDFGFGQPSNYETAMPSHMLENFKEKAKSAPCSSHQGTNASGEPNLLRILSAMYSKLCDRQVDPFNEILVTCGATEALYCAVLANVEPGGEVIIIEPAYDAFYGLTKLARALPVCIKLKGPGWVLDADELRSKFNSKTKMIIINTPHNPTGKMFSKGELTSIANLCKEFDVLCLSDEVYEFMKVGAKDHDRIASFEGMWERTIAVGSVAKSFGLTGWRIGWAYGSKHLIKKMTKYHLFTTYNCPTILQEVVATAFEHELPLMGTDGSYWLKISEMLEKKEKRIARILMSVGMKPLPVDGTYYIVVDISDLLSKVHLGSEEGKADVKFAKWMISELGVGTIPGSLFYKSNSQDAPENYVRLCFIKDDKLLDELEKRIAPLHRILSR